MLETQQRANEKSTVQSRSSGYANSSRKLKERELCIYWVSVNVYHIQLSIEAVCFSADAQIWECLLDGILGGLACRLEKRDALVDELCRQNSAVTSQNSVFRTFGRGERLVGHDGADKISLRGLSFSGGSLIVISHISIRIISSGSVYWSGRLHRACKARRIQGRCGA